MKRICFILALFFLPFGLRASCCKFIPAFKVSYYRFNSNVLRGIYGCGGVLFQGELNYRVCRSFYLFVDAGYLEKHGRALGCGKNTRIEIVPVSFGAKYFYSWYKCLDAYLGAGLRYFFVDIHNKSNFVRGHVCDNGIGGVVSGGLYYRFLKCFVFNPFVEYSWRNFHFSRSRKDRLNNIQRHDFNMGGWSFGGGIGYCF